MRSTAPWCSQDLFFLTDALRRGGMSYAEVARFLGRDVAQVRDKAKHLSIKSRHIASRDREEKTQHVKGVAAVGAFAKSCRSR